MTDFSKVDILVPRYNPVNFGEKMFQVSGLGCENLDVVNGVEHAGKVEVLFPRNAHRLQRLYPLQVPLRWSSELYH